MKEGNRNMVVCKLFLVGYFILNFIMSIVVIFKWNEIERCIGVKKLYIRHNKVVVQFFMVLHTMIAGITYVIVSGMDKLWKIYFKD